MSGNRNLANAIANDPSFAKQTKGIMTASEAKMFVSEPPKSAAMPRGVKSTAPKPRSY
jgi:hypothetical protein